MLIGQHHSKVGAKGRAAFPKKFREELGSNLVITQGYEGSLIVVSEEGWKALLEGTEDKPFIIGSARDTQRFLLGGATLVELDEQGRFILPDYLREYGEIGEEVIFLGLYRYVEIWDSQRWVEYQKYLKDHISEIAQKLSEVTVGPKT